MSAGSRLRSMLEAGRVVVAPGAYDPISALVVRSLGFEAVYVGGYMSGAHLGVSEPLMTVTEQLDVAKKVAHASQLSVICDGDAGFGDPLHAMRCVREFEGAGIAAIHIEDQVYPKRASYHKGLEHITPLEEFVTKIRYCLQARRNPDFLIVGRTDAFSAVEGSREETVRRGQALKEVGVDAIFFRGVTEPEDLAYFREAVPDIPLMVIGGVNDISVDEYRALGYQIIIYAITPIVSAVDALNRNYRALRETGRTEITAAKMSELRATVEELISLPEYYRVEAETTERT